MAFCQQEETHSHVTHEVLEAFVKVYVYDFNICYCGLTVRDEFLLLFFLRAVGGMLQGKRMLVLLSLVRKLLQRFHEIIMGDIIIRT